MRICRQGRHHTSTIFVPGQACPTGEFSAGCGCRRPDALRRALRTMSPSSPVERQGANGLSGRMWVGSGAPLWSTGAGFHAGKTNSNLSTSVFVTTGEISGEWAILEHRHRYHHNIMAFQRIIPQLKFESRPVLLRERGPCREALRSRSRP